jgi:nicotinamidase-related amidase
MTSTRPFDVDAARAALVVVDLQNDFVRDGAPQEVPDARTMLGAVADLVGAARSAGVPVVFTRFCAGPLATPMLWWSPECGPEQRSCWPGEMRVYDDRPDALAGRDIVPELEPQPGEVVVDKYGYGSFHQTVLGDVLRAHHVTQVWICGTVTQICVEETVREGFRDGFEMVVAADLVASFDADLHAATLRNLAMKFALVVSAADLHAAAAALRATNEAPDDRLFTRTQ